MAVMERPAFLLSLLFCFVYGVYTYDVENKRAPSDFEERFLALAMRVEQLESRDRLQQAEIEALKMELNAEKQRSTKLESRDRLQQGEIEALKTELSAQKQRSTQLELLVKNLWTRKPSFPVPDQVTSNNGSVTGDTNDEVHRANLAQRIRRAEVDQTVAFYATKAIHALHTGKNQNIVFETLVTNVGGAYSNTLGAFQAPVDGIYVFSVNLMAYSTQTEHYHLSKNSKPVCYLYARAAEAPYAATGQTAILRLAQGDNVEIQTQDSDGSVHGGAYSSFAGFLLQQEYGNPAVVGANLAQRIRRAEVGQTVAFYATKANHALHMGQNQNIVFETLVTNVGGAYSNTLGAFQAPVDGIYVFSVNLLAYGSQAEHYHLSKNSKPVCYLYARATEAGQTAILRLAQGDNVEIRTQDSDGSVHGYGYSSFAGFLLQQEYGNPAVVGK